MDPVQSYDFLAPAKIVFGWGRRTKWAYWDGRWAAGIYGFRFA